MVVPAAGQMKERAMPLCFVGPAHQQAVKTVQPFFSAFCKENEHLRRS